MSTIYVFNKTESVITASGTSTGTTGANMVSTDSLLIYNSVPNTVNQTQVGSVSGIGKLENISTNTSSSFTSFPVLSPYGTSTLNSVTTGLVAYLPGAPGPGLFKTVSMWATSTTTAVQVVCTSTGVTIAATGASSNVFKAIESIFFNQPAAYVDLISGSTSVWMLVGQSVGGLTFTTTTST